MQKLQITFYILHRKLHETANTFYKTVQNSLSAIFNSSYTDNIYTWLTHSAKIC